MLNKQLSFLFNCAPKSSYLCERLFTPPLVFHPHLIIAYFALFRTNFRTYTTFLVDTRIILPKFGPYSCPFFRFPPLFLPNLVCPYTIFPAFSSEFGLSIHNIHRFFFLIWFWLWTKRSFWENLHGNVCLWCRQIVGKLMRVITCRYTVSTISPVFFFS